MKILSNLLECTQKEQELYCFMMIRLIAHDYHYNNLFHGDIKPDNIFIQDNAYGRYTTSDVGSLLYIGE